MKEWVEQRIVTALVGVVLGAMTLYFSSRSIKRQAGRVVALLTITLGWLTVYASVRLGYLSASDGLDATVWIFVGAILGTMLRIRSEYVQRVTGTRPDDCQ